MKIAKEIGGNLTIEMVQNHAKSFDIDANLIRRCAFNACCSLIEDISDLESHGYCAKREISQFKLIAHRFKVWDAVCTLATR